MLRMIWLTMLLMLHKTGDLYTNIVAKCYVAYQKELRQSESVDFDDLIMLTLRLFDQNPDVLTYYQKSSNISMLMSTKIPTTLNINSLNFGFTLQNDLCGWGCWPVLFTDGVALICRISSILKKIIQRPRLFYWRKITVLPKPSSKRLMMLLKTIKNRRPKNLWTQNADGEQIIITVQTTNRMRLSL